METIFRTDSLLLWLFTVYLTCSGYHYICFTYLTLFFHVLHSANPCLYNFIFSWSCSAQISAGMHLWVLVLLKSPVINKPLPLLSAGSAATTKKICLSGMSANQPQQRSRRISIISTPNLTVSNSDTSFHICLVDVCWVCLTPLQLFTGTSGSMCRKGAQRKWVLQWRFIFHWFIYLFGSGINLN